MRVKLLISMQFEPLNSPIPTYLVSLYESMNLPQLGAYNKYSVIVIRII
jgi:hypothetical protein